MPAGNMPKGSPGADELWQHRDSQAARETGRMVCGAC